MLKLTRRPGRPAGEASGARHWRPSSRPLKTGAALLAAALLGAAVPALASSGSSPVTYDACVTNATGAIKIVSSTATCATGQHKISWNNIGPQGPRGLTGPSGPAGPPGPQGPAGVVAGYSAQNASGVALNTTSATQVLSFRPPAGSYIVTANIQDGILTGTDWMLCHVIDGTAIIGGAQTTVAVDSNSGFGWANATTTFAATLSGGPITITCTDSASDGSAFAQITAIPVAALH